MGTVNTLLEATLVGFMAAFFLNVVRYWLITKSGIGSSFLSSP